MTIKFADFATTTVAVAPSGSSGLTLTLAAGTGARFPALSSGEMFPGVIEAADGSAREAVMVTARVGDVLTVTRSAAPVAWSGSGQTFFLDITTAAVARLVRADEHSVTPAPGLTAPTVQAALEVLAASLTAASASLAAAATTAALTAAVNGLNTSKPNMAVGTRTLFHQAAAPAGWTQDVAVNDRVIRVVSSAGGGSGGSWTISGITVDGHALAAAEMPAHTHTLGGQITPGLVNYATGHGTTWVGWTTTGTTSSAGGGGAHTHGLTIGSSWRPAYTDVIVCTRAS